MKKPPFIITLQDADRFWSKVQKGRGCWNWQAGVFSGTGYGQFHIKAYPFLAHRIAYRISIGNIPSGMCILHRCDNRRCVNPHHLFIGTKGDNNRDAYKKGRNRVGERHWKSVLTSSDVRDIKRLYKAGRTQKELGEIFGVKQAHISNIVLSRAWKHLEVSRG